MGFRDNSLGKGTKINTSWSKDDLNLTIMEGLLSIEFQ